MPDDRSPPEAFLAQAARTGRGRLKVFLGAAPGVGKTFGMLQDARDALREGRDVVAAVIETHGRAETGALLDGIPVLPRRTVAYRDRTLTEMDLDGLLARRPEIALIDELAHTNVEGSRHEKRWQDVEEVLAAGIDVYTTVNVQHVETLNEAVARITGVRVRETVPDRILDGAEEIELIDLPPDELLGRLRDGKVYVPEQAQRAAQGFFAKGNLVALRELALRTAADRVDAQLREHMALNAIPGPWPTADRILAVITEDPSARDVIRLAKRAADRAHAEWIALAVTSSRSERLGEEARGRVADALRLAERLGAEVVTVVAEEDAAGEVLDQARRRNVRRLVLGRPPREGWQGRLVRTLGAEDLARDLLRRGRDFEITLASGEARPRGPTRWPSLRPTEAWRAYLPVLPAVALATGLAWVVDATLPVTSLALLYMTAVVAVAASRGLGPAMATSVLGFLAYNFFFTEPRLSFAVSQRGVLLTLVLFLAASILTGNLAARLRSRIDAQRAIGDRLAKLHDFGRRVAMGATADEVAWAAASNVAATLGRDSMLLMAAEDGGLAIAAAFPPEDHLPTRDRSAALYAWDKGEAAGHGTGTLPTADWLFLPVRVGDRRLAVLGLKVPEGRGSDILDRAFLDSLTDQMALALERVRLAEELAGTQLATETERLRTALLSSVSHDLRTPLVTIIGAADHLAEAPDAPEPLRRELAGTIREEGHRLDRYVQNLLDMTRLEHGALRPRLAEVDLADLLGQARHRLRAALAQHRVEVAIPPDLPALKADPVLLEQVLVNILDNAAKHAPAGTAIRVDARAEGPRAVVGIADEGPGIPEESRERVFDMFFRVEAGDGQAAGTGLGLAICRGLVEAQGGTIRAKAATPEGQGTRIVLDLPLADARWDG